MVLGFPRLATDFSPWKGEVMGNEARSTAAKGGGVLTPP